MNADYPLGAAAFSYFCGHITAILDGQIRAMVECYSGTGMRKRVDRFPSGEGMNYSRMASQGSILRASKCHSLPSGSQILSFSVPPEIIRSLVKDRL